MRPTRTIRELMVEAGQGAGAAGPFRPLRQTKWALPYATDPQDMQPRPKSLAGKVGSLKLAARLRQDARQQLVVALSPKRPRHP